MGCFSRPLCFFSVLVAAFVVVAGGLAGFFLAGGGDKEASSFMSFSERITGLPPGSRVEVVSVADGKAEAYPARQAGADGVVLYAPGDGMQFPDSLKSHRVDYHFDYGGNRYTDVSLSVIRETGIVYACVTGLSAGDRVALSAGERRRNAVPVDWGGNVTVQADLDPASSVVVCVDLLQEDPVSDTPVVLCHAVALRQGAGSVTL